MSSTHKLSVSDLSLRFGGIVALNGLSFTVEEGSICGLIGPNGAGKSTLLQILATKIFPTQGVVRVLDKQMGTVDLFELRTRIGICGSVIAEDIPFENVLEFARHLSLLDMSDNPSSQYLDLLDEDGVFLQ